MPGARLAVPMRVAMTLEQCWHRVPGGIAQSAVGLARALAAAPDLGVDVVGVAARHLAPPLEPSFRPPVQTRHLPLRRRELYLAWQLPGPLRWPAVQQATGPVDVVHATAATIPPTAGAPLVATVHDLAFRDLPGGLSRRTLAVLERGLALARRHAAVVVVPSAATARACAAAGFDEGRLRIVPWGHDTEPAPAEEVARVRSTYSLPDRYVLFVGTLEPRKNLARLVEAWQKVDAAGDAAATLVVAGPAGWGEQGEALDGVPGVRRLGFVPAADRDALYAGAAVVAYPSLAEGFGLPVLEAMAQGAPVVTSAGTATEEVAGDAAVLVDPTDAGAIADGLRSLLDDEAAASALGARARARAATFTWRACAEGYAAAYHDSRR